MKTLIHNITKESKYVWADTTSVTLSETTTYTPDFNIGDMNSTNATLVENVTPPEDWVGCKYLYDNGTWTVNPNWIDPNTPEA
jgi:thiamine pyrophosphokinase